MTASPKDQVPWTPGPYEVLGDDEGSEGPYIEVTAGVLGTPSFRAIAYVQPNDDELAEEDWANAALLAESPTMAALLEELVAIEDEECRFDHNGYCQSHCLDHVLDGCRVEKARALLSRIRGKA